MNLELKRNDLSARQAELQKVIQRTQAVQQEAQQRLNQLFAELLRVEGGLAMLSELEAESGIAVPAE